MVYFVLTSRLYQPFDSLVVIFYLLKINVKVDADENNLRYYRTTRNGLDAFTFERGVMFYLNNVFIFNKLLEL